MDGISKELAGKYVIAYDVKEDTGQIMKQALFFGYYDGRAAILHDSAQIYDSYSEALSKLHVAKRSADIDPDNLLPPYIVEIPN